MVKKIAVSLMSMALCGILYAEEIGTSQTFIGLELGATTVQGDGARGDENGVEFGLRIGAQDEQWRTTVVLNYFDKNDFNTEKLMLDVDYFFQEGITNFKPYIGVNFGYANFEVAGTEDADGFLYGMQAGFVVDVTEEIDVDLSYKYSLSSSDELDHTGSLIFGLNYHL